MGRNRKGKLGVSDVAAAWRAGWSPSDVNAILDRLEAMGDPNEPIVTQSETEDDITEPIDAVVDDVSEDVDEDETIENETDEEDDEDVKAAKDTLGQLKQTALEVENTRLKNEIEKLQAANRRKDVSIDDPKQSIENSLIDTFQSLFS